MQLDRFEEAADWAMKAMAQSNATFWARVQLIAVQSAAGEAEKAKKSAVDLLRSEPTFSSHSFAEQFLFYHHDTSSIGWYCGILRAVGLPE